MTRPERIIYRIVCEALARMSPASRRRALAKVHSIASKSKKRAKTSQ
jgi:hypothetical protein